MPLGGEKLKNQQSQAIKKAGKILLAVLLLGLVAPSSKAETSERIRVMRWWYQGQPAVPLASALEYDCFLGAVGGRFEGGGELVRIYLSTQNGEPYWFIGGLSQQAGVKGYAICVPISEFPEEDEESVTRAEISEIQGKVQTLESLAENLAGQTDSLTSQTTTISQSVSRVESKSDAVAREVADNSESIRAFTTAQDDLTNQIEQLRSDVQKLQELMATPNRNSIIARLKKWRRR